MPVYSLFGRLFYNTFRSTKALKWLSANAILGNIILVLLVAIASITFIKGVTEDSISARQICNAVSDDAEVLLVAGDSDVDMIRSQRNLDRARHKMTTCTYEVERSSGSERRAFDVTYRVAAKELTSGIDEKKITKADMESVCEDESVYRRKEGEEEGIDFSPVDVKRILSDNRRVYPVFRWRCQYFPPARASAPPSEAGVVPDARPVEMGLNLDNFCARTYGNEGLDKATFHHYDESNSWFCTNPNLTANFVDAL